MADKGEIPLSLLEQVISNPVVSMISLVIAILGILLTFIFHSKSKKNKDPRFSVRSNSLLKDFTQQIDGLGISFSGKPIDTLSVLNFVFWNKGKDTIHGNDIPQLDPFIIKILDDKKILAVKKVYGTNDSNNIIQNISDNKLELHIDFEYLDYGDGFVLQILHTGEDSNCISICGSIKSAGKLSKREVSIKPLYVQFMDKFFKKRTKKKTSYVNSGFKILGWLTFIASLFMIAIGIYNMIFLNESFLSSFGTSFIVIFMYGALGLDLIKTRVPPTFKHFFERVR